MMQLGMRMSTYGANDLTLHMDWPSRPVAFPNLPEGHYVVCGFGQGKTERLFIADTFEDMMQLYDAYNNGAGTCH